MFALIAAIFGGGLAKILSFFGGSVITGVLGAITNAQTQKTLRITAFTTALTSALTADVARYQASSNERIALWGSFWYRVLVYLIVAPPALHAAGIYIDTLFTFIDWKIPAAPYPYNEWEMTVLATFIGVGGGVAAIIGAAKYFGLGK